MAPTGLPLAVTVTSPRYEPGTASSGTLTVHQKNSVLWADMLQGRPSGTRTSRPPSWKLSTDRTTTLPAGMMAPAGPLRSPAVMDTCANASAGRSRKLNGSYSPAAAKSLASRGLPARGLRTLTLAGD